MDQHFIKNIDIVKFKCFENFSSSGFNRVNLISGKNNVGKTAFLEALFIHIAANNVASFASALFSIKYMRENINMLSSKPNNYAIKFMEATKEYTVNSNIKKTHYKTIQNEGKKDYLFNINSENNTIQSNIFSFTTTRNNNIKFIDNFGFSDSEIVTVFSAVQKNDKEIYLNKIINKFDSRINGFKVIESKPQCKIGDEYIEITEFGDGLRHLISIVCALFASAEGQLFIDEIDNGIHYTQLEKIWEIIFTVSKEVKCQVFATSHSKEMIEAFNNTAQRSNYKDISYIEFGLKEDEIKALVYDYDTFTDEMNQNHEIRGW